MFINPFVTVFATLKMWQTYWDAVDQSMAHYYSGRVLVRRTLLGDENPNAMKPGELSGL